MAFIDTQAELADLRLKWQRQQKILEAHDDLLTGCDECGIYFFDEDDGKELQLQTLPCHECCLCEECRNKVFPFKSCRLCSRELCWQCADNNNGLCDTCMRNSSICEVCESPFLIENKDCFICDCGNCRCAKCNTPRLTSCSYCVETVTVDSPSLDHTLSESF